ncbi:hypothetical protein ACTXG7_16050 [Mycolicibacterium sp. Dal123E01]|uniref:hypothetical protein n=1 Tax=Mycolicibacterium sp. Dal123E01 TaxID=3457578 RepID=UPI00403E680D
MMVGFVLLLGFAIDAFHAQELDLFGGQVHVTLMPLWPFLCGVSLGSGSAATAFVILATRKDAPRHQVVMAWCAGIVVPLIPALILAANRMWQTIPVALIWVAASAIVVCYVNVLHRAPSPWVGLLLACLVALVWFPVVVINIRAVAALGTDWPQDPNELLVLFAHNSPVEAFAFSFALFFVAVMTAAGVALVAHSRSTITDRWHRGAPRWVRAGVLCLCAIVIVTIEVTGVGGLSSGYYAGYWGLRSPGTWPHALVVAALIAYVAERSWHMPLVRRGDVFTTILVGIGALAGSLVMAVVMTASLIMGALKGEFTVIPPPFENLDLVIMWLALLALIPFAVRRTQRGTAGQWVARVALLYLAPVFVAITATRYGLKLSSFWATPAQVAICLVGIACVATLLGLAGREPFLHQQVASRVAIIPILIVAGTSWLPSFISHPLTPYIAIAAALYTLLWAMPPVSADEERHSGLVLATSAQLLVVAAAAAIATTHKDFTPDDPTMALLFFSVPLSALLCARVAAAQPSPPRRSRQPVPRSAHLPT